MLTPHPGLTFLFLCLKWQMVALWTITHTFGAHTQTHRHRHTRTHKQAIIQSTATTIYPITTHTAGVTLQNPPLINSMQPHRADPLELSWCEDQKLDCMKKKHWFTFLRQICSRVASLTDTFMSVSDHKL